MISRPAVAGVGLYYLRDAEGRVCCTMRAGEMRKVVGGVQGEIAASPYLL